VVRLNADGSLVRIAGHFSGKRITNGRFNATMGGVTFQFDSERVKAFLSIGQWRPLPKRRKGGGYVSRDDNRAADAKLMTLMAERPTAGVRELAQALGVSHPAVSRRIGRLKAMGLVRCNGAGWEVGISDPNHTCAPWVKPISCYGRSLADDHGGVNNSESDDAPRTRRSARMDSGLARYG
jgi:hypothetical protein